MDDSIIRELIRRLHWRAPRRRGAGDRWGPHLIAMPPAMLDRRALPGCYGLVVGIMVPGWAGEWN